MHVPSTRGRTDSCVSRNRFFRDHAACTINITALCLFAKIAPDFSIRNIIVSTVRCQFNREIPAHRRCAAGKMRHGRRRCSCISQPTAAQTDSTVPASQPAIGGALTADEVTIVPNDDSLTITVENGDVSLDCDELVLQRDSATGRDCGG